MLPMFAGRMFPFDLTCTTAYAELLAKVREAGSGIETADACIAAVAIANGLSVATRDGNPFRAAGLVVIDPWEAARGSDGALEMKGRLSKEQGTTTIFANFPETS